MDIVLPLQRMALNIFEPRYRLLIRRAMSGSRTFGMIGLNRRGQLYPVGCEVQIEDCNCLPDGRFEIEVIGVRRFSVEKCEEQDGYRLAHAEYIRDQESLPTQESVVELASLVDEKIEAFLDGIKARQGGRGAILNALVRCAGNKPAKPSAEGKLRQWCEDISFYVGVILSQLQAVNPLAMLEMTSTKDRLELLNKASVLNL